MNRIDQSEEKIKELFGVVDLQETVADPDLVEILNRFVYGEVAYQGNLNDTMKELITLVVLTTSGTPEQVGEHVGAALNIGVSPVEIKEALYQCAPYIGFPKTLCAVQRANAVFQEREISLPVESQRQVTEETRFDEGLKVQKSIFGDIIDSMRKNAPKNLTHIQDYLSAYCFGDIYTRSGLDLQARELLTLCILIALGGCESQVKSHINGNKSVGNDKETLISAITQCLPYVGFPRTLNALASLNEVIPEEN